MEINIISACIGSITWWNYLQATHETRSEKAESIHRYVTTKVNKRIAAIPWHNKLFQ